MTSTSASWKVVSSSVIGTSHARTGLPCQDAHKWLNLPDGTLLLAVADGAGSAGRADQGSQIAVKNALEFMEWNLSQNIPDDDAAWELLLRDALQDSRLALEKNCQEEELHQLATTLLLVVATEQTLATAQIGDGAIVLRKHCGDLCVLTPKSDSEYINETHFLTGPAFQQNVHCTVQPSGDIDAIAAFTDGVQYLAIQFPLNQAHPGFFNPLFAFAAGEDAASSELEAFLSSAKVSERTDDDKTLVLAVRNACA